MTHRRYITLATFSLGACALIGCTPGGPTTRPAASTSSSTNNVETPAAHTPAQTTVASINGRTITVEQLQRPLIDTFGLPLLLNLVQLELAKQEASIAKVTVTPDDVAKERSTTLKTMFRDAPKEDYDRLLTQFLEQKRMSKVEFDTVIATNAHLRKIAEPKLTITDDNLQEAFRALYGENVEVRDIVLNNLQEVAVVRQRLANGEPFEKVAREVSRDPRTQPLGGLLPPFSRQMTNLSDAFKEAAFSLKEPGEVSDPVQTGESFHLIQLVRKIAPKAVKFEDVKEAVRTELADRWMQNQLREMHRELGRLTLQSLDIKDPVLKKQFEDMLGKQQADARKQQETRQAAEAQRRQLSEKQTLPAATSAPSTAEAPQRPPATKSSQ